MFNIFTVFLMKTFISIHGQRGCWGLLHRKWKEAWFLPRVSLSWSRTCGCRSGG